MSIYNVFIITRVQFIYRVHALLCIIGANWHIRKSAGVEIFVHIGGLYLGGILKTEQSKSDICQLNSKKLWCKWLAFEKYWSFSNKKMNWNYIFFNKFHRNCQAINMLVNEDMFCVILCSGAICLFGAIYQSEFDLKFRIEKSIFIFSWSNLPSWSNLSRCNLQTSTVYIPYGNTIPTIPHTFRSQNWIK